MLLIEHCDVEETIKLGSLFDELNFSQNSKPNDCDGDTLIPCDWPIEVLSTNKFNKIQALRWTKPERMIDVHFQRNDLQSPFSDVEKFQSMTRLRCSPEHLVAVLINQQTKSLKWIRSGDLKVGDLLRSNVKEEFLKVKKIEIVEGIQRLCDLQVSDDHTYYTNDILSHNSHFLVNAGATALLAGKNVLHYTLELSETAVGVRYDSNLCNIDSGDVIVNKELILKQYSEAKMGRLIIKEFPTSTATIYTIRAHVERLSLKGFNPDVIIIDYADIMRSTRQYDSLRYELKLIYEELRGFAVEKNVPIVTASQSNKEGASAEVIDMTNMSEAYGKAAVCDVILSISRRIHEKASGGGRLYVCKNRAGKDGLLYNIKIDTARSKFEIEGQSTMNDAEKNDTDALKEQIKKRWAELKNDELLAPNNVQSQDTKTSDA